MSKADVQLEPGFAVGTPEILFRNSYVWGTGPPSYDISPLDQRFLVMQNIEAAEVAEEAEEVPEVSLAIVDNWFEELKRISPTGTSE